MLTLIDLSAEYWKNWFGSGSALDSYTLTIDRVQFYTREWPRTVVCCDSPKSLRKDMLPSYKSNRKPRPEEAWDSLRSVEQRVRAWGVPVVMCDGYEADDVIAALCSQAFPEEVQVIGSEKDLYCLLATETVRLVGKSGYIFANDCVTKFGVAPSQMPDWLALVGDAADAIQGCPGCGPGRASALLEMFGTLDGIRSASDADILSVPGVGKKTLEGLRSWDPKMARELVRLRDDAPVSLADLFQATAASAAQE